MLLFSFILGEISFITSDFTRQNCRYKAVSTSDHFRLTPYL